MWPPKTLKATMKATEAATPSPAALGWFVVGAALLALATPSLVSAGEAREAEARALIAKYECHRCHDIAGVTPAPQNKHCVHCHQAIETGTFEGPADVVKEWRARITHLLDVPALRPGDPLLRREWLSAFLQNPIDLRPRLEASMPRLALSSQEAETLASWLSAPTPTGEGQKAEASAPTGDAQRGRRLLGERGCTVCHAFTGAPTSPLHGAALGAVAPAQVAKGLKLAPDLRHARRRLHGATLSQWILKPSSMRPGTAMPALARDAQEAADMAAWILSAPLTPLPSKAGGDPWAGRLPLLQRAVAYEEIEARVFKKVCWHCHSDPDFALGDGGPGNTGGFGFQGRGISFAERADVLSGGEDAQGEFRSLLKPLAPGQPPWVVAVLMARRAEVKGEPVPGLRGMPLGLPPMSLEDIQVVETWAHQMTAP